MNRRGFLTGLGALIATPAIVRASSLMPIRVMPSPMELEFYGLSPAMVALENIEYLQGLIMRRLSFEDTIVYTRIPDDSWRQMNAPAPSGVWRGMPGGVQ